jgi:hypothetical protein
LNLSLLFNLTIFFSERERIEDEKQRFEDYEEPTSGLRIEEKYNTSIGGRLGRM